MKLDNDLLPKLRPKTKAFLDEILANPKTNQTDAYLKTHKTTNRGTARVESSKTLTKPNSLIYLKKHVDAAKANMIEIAMDKSIKPDTRIKALQDILDRNLGKAVQRAHVETTNLNLNIEASQELSDKFTEFLKSSTSPVEPI